MRKGMLVLLLIMFSLSFVVAEETIFGTYEQGETLDLIQTCSDCTYNNITSVVLPDGVKILTNNVQMTKDGTSYNYTIGGDRTQQLGRYLVNGMGDLGGVKTVWNYDFEITPSGSSGTLGFYFLILILSGGVIIFGLWKEDAPITILGSFGLYFIGLYILFFGIDGMKDPTYTWAIGIIILMLAAYISVKSAYELIVN